MIEARRATRDDIAGVAATLARAFDDDPVMCWLFGDDGRRRATRLRRFFVSEAGHHLALDGLLTGPGHEGAALWAPPQRWRMTWTEMLRSAPTMTRAIAWRLPRALRIFQAMERAHPRQPHWYLALLGTDPPSQGRGVGAALMRPILDRCDRAGLGAYLESSKESNVPYYERFGFTVTGEVTPRGGPTMWPMWRDPQA